MAMFLLILILAVFITGFISAIYYQKNKPKFVGIIVLTIASCGVIFFFLSISLTGLHKDEIRKVIKQQGGQVISILKVNSNDSPFKNEISKTNIIYKIMYKKSNTDLIAWYRGINNASNIHAIPSIGYGEKWIFENEKNDEIFWMMRKE